MQNLSICLVQTDILWERRDENLQLYSQKLEQLKSQPDLIVLPEMFSTGFSMNANSCSEKEHGPILEWMKSMA
jgi:predicted amidohydrolase